MGLSADFQEMATDFITDDFSDVAKTLVIKTPDAPVFGSAQTYTSETGSGIDVGFDLSRVDGLLIQVGDLLVFTNASDWSTEPTAASEITFDSKPYQVINIEKNAADAAYFVQLRSK